MAVNERRRVIINFKNTPEDIELFEELKRHSSISGYIKDILRGVVSLNNTAQATILNSNINDSNNSKEEKESLDVDNILGGI